MANFKKRIFVDVLLVITCIVLLAFIANYYHKQKIKNEKVNTKEYALKEQVVWDLYYHYEELKKLAFNWNYNYARLSLNSNRDTIEHPKYTVKQLRRMHNSIMSSIDNYENNSLINHYTTEITQILNLYPISYDSQQLFSTYMQRDKLYTQAKDLNDIYVSLILNSKSTDSVNAPYSPDSKSYPYLTSLRKLDRTIYNLLSDEYPRSLKYAISTEKEFVIKAKERLFNKQVSELRFPSEYHVYTPEALNLKQNMEACLGERENKIKNLEFEVNQGKALLLVAMDTIDDKDTQQIKNSTAAELYTCYKNIKKDYDRELFLYIESPDGMSQIRWPKQESLVEASEQNLNYLYTFYEDNSLPYIVEGTFSPLYLWYPNSIDDAIKEFKKR